ncbi:Uncharacterised protein [Mycobacteroides abscessus subsp. massiliense]|nr:Uncharacterised protein [Mycobacteroides abscessus subsp. massiliense]SLD17455.1 Uncharacterised protein [Mycobacteroides abscessus subsp. massiliense]
MAVCAASTFPTTDLSWREHAQMCPNMRYLGIFGHARGAACGVRCSRRGARTSAHHRRIGKGESAGNGVPGLGEQFHAA